MVETSSLDPVFTSDQVAERYSVSPHTIAKWATCGTGPKYLKIGRHRRYRLADLLAWEEAQVAVDERRTA